MMNEYIISTGSIFLSGAFSSLLYPPKIFELSSEELEKKIKEAIILVSEHKSSINAPFIMNRLNCDAKTANKILNILVERGYLIPEE